MRSNVPARTLDPVATKASIVEAATRLFADKGFSATSTSEIAERAGVTKSLVLYHFATKEALWREVLDAKTSPIRELAAKIMDDDAPFSAADFIRAKFDSYRNDPDFPRFLAWMSLEPTLATPEMRERASGVKSKIEADPTKYGLPKHMDPMAFMMVLMSAVDGYFRFRNLYSVMLGSKVVSQEAESEFFDVLMSLAFPPEKKNGV